MDKSTYTEIIGAIKEAALSRNIDQKTLSKLSGVSPTTVNEVFNSKRDPRGSTLRKLAQVLDINIKRMNFADKGEDLNNSERILIEMFRKLNLGQRIAVQQMVVKHLEMNSVKVEYNVGDSLEGQAVEPYGGGT